MKYENNKLKKKEKKNWKMKKWHSLIIYECKKFRGKLDKYISFFNFKIGCYVCS